jgi:hypothetical protein
LILAKSRLFKFFIRAALTFSVLVSALAFMPLPAALAEAGDELVQTVKMLGLAADKPARGFEILARSPRQASVLLVGQLHTLKRGLYYPSQRTDQTRHVLACLRALHYLSGRTFAAPTAAKLSDDERQFLDFDQQMHDTNPLHRLHFFSVWMSRDADYIAPEDAQTAIIKQWQQLIKEEREPVNYKPAADPSKWMNDFYWFG